MLNRLETSEEIKILPNLQGCLTVENPTFIEGRYFFTESELLEQIKKMYHAADQLQELQIPFVNTCLLYGRSGTGKTTLGRYIAHEMKLPFLYANFSYILDSYLGNTGKNLQRCFEFAGKQPCVFMIDEIDALGQMRGVSNDVGEMNRIVIALMQNMDQLPNHVLFLAATNRRDVLDEALLRRFLFKKEIKPFSKEQRIKLTESYFESISLPISKERILKLAEPEQTQAKLISQIIYTIATEKGELL